MPRQEPMGGNRVPKRQREGHPGTHREKAPVVSCHTEAQAKEICLRLLTGRARSRAELAECLVAKGCVPDIVDRTLDRLAEVGLIDDAAFAEQWVRSRHVFSGKGKKALAQELRHKGVAGEDVESALAGISAAAEHARAADLVRRKLRSLPPDLGRDKAIRRMVGMLARRGYQQSTAYAVVKAELAQVYGVEHADPFDAFRAADP